MDERANGLVSKREPQRAHATGSARSVLQRASDFASPHFGTPVFPREFVGCSVPVLSAVKPKVFSGFFAFLASCFGFPARPRTCMLAGAAQINQQLYCAALDAGESSSESPESPRNPRFSSEHRWF